ncbi:MAG: hypothetical protein WDZ64_01740 [Parcubacteria group bacterium]
MILVTVFTVSGVAIIVLMVAKRLEIKRESTPNILRLVSKGDTKLRNLHHKTVDLYFETKDNLGFLIKKKAPTHFKLSFNKMVGRLKTQLEEYINDLREAKLIKKQGGISEFFKNISESEKTKDEEKVSLKQVSDETTLVEIQKLLQEMINDTKTEQVEKPKRKRKTKNIGAKDPEAN